MASLNGGRRFTSEYPTTRMLRAVHGPGGLSVKAGAVAGSNTAESAATRRFVLMPSSFSRAEVRRRMKWCCPAAHRPVSFCLARPSSRLHRRHHPVLADRQPLGTERPIRLARGDREQVHAGLQL